MATPKKKISRSRRDKRRYSSSNQLKAVNWVNSPQTGQPTRSHRVTLETLDAYLTARNERKKSETGSKPTAPEVASQTDA